MDSNNEQPYVFLPESGEPSSTPPQRPVSGNRKPSPWLWLILGIPLGILGTILVQQAGTSGHQTHRVLPVTSVSASPVSSPTPVPTSSADPTASPSGPPLSGDPKDFPPGATATPGGANPSLPPGATVPGGPTPIPTTVPGGAKPGPSPGPMGNPMPRPMQGTITGPVTPLPNVVSPIHPNVEGGPGSQPVASEDVGLVTMALTTGENEVDGTLGRVSSVASRFGGRAAKFTELAEKKEGDKSAILVVVPADKKDGALSALKALGATRSDDWNGTPQERQNLIEERLVLTLHDLQREKEKLLVKYFDDAGPVKDMDDRIEDARKQLRAVRVGKGNNVILRVYVGPNA
jgi:hypothetical protein